MIYSHVGRLTDQPRPRRYKKRRLHRAAVFYSAHQQRRIVLNFSHDSFLGDLSAASITSTAAVLGLCQKTIQDLNIDREKLPNSHS